MNSEKNKRARPHDLGPLNLSKTQYKPYFGGLPGRKNKQNISLAPLENIMFDIPQIEETHAIQYSTVQKLRIKITKFFEQKSLKSKQQWIFYTKKSEILSTTNNAWTQLQTYLLKIINDVFTNCKSLTQSNNQLLKFKEQVLQNDQSVTNINYSPEHTKICQKYNKTCNISKFDCTLNQYSSILRSNEPVRSKVAGKSQYKHPSKYTGSVINENSIVQSNQNDVANYHILKISKLQKQIELYKERIKTIEQTHKQKLQLIQKQVEMKLGAKFNQTMQQKTKIQVQVQSKRWYNDILAQQVLALKKKYASLQSQYTQFKNKYEKIKQDKTKMQSLYQYRQLWLMQYEEILQLNRQIYELKAEKELQLNKNKGLKQKLKELSKNFNYNYNVSMENQKDKQDLNTVLKDFRDWLKFFAVPRVSKGMMNNNTFFPQLNTDSHKQSFSNLLPKDDTTNYKLLRPNFFIYFEAYQSIIVAQKKFPQRKVMPPTFYLTIRAILDAMFLHFNYNSDYKQWYSFPQFVISFIQKFQINAETQKVVVRKSPCQSEEKINFVLNLFNIQAANSWQCQIFRSFILEQFTPDQIYFYLQCRDNLLRGSHLNNNLGSGDSITYIKVSIAQDVIKQKLKNYERQMLERMKKFLNSKKKSKYNRELIDLNFVLKLLLEVYSIQKIKSQRFFHHNFKSKTPTAKISYTQYSAFMTKNFNFLTKSDIAKLYRQMYTLGVSHITYKTIHFVCSTRGLFIPLLRSKLSTKALTQIDAKYPKTFEDILFLDIQNSLNNMLIGIQQLGLEDLINNIISMNKFLHDSEQLGVNRSNFHCRLLQQTQKILKIRSILAWKNQKSKLYEQLTKDEVRQKLGYLLSIIHHSDQDVNYVKKNRQIRQKAIIKLTRNFKIRIQQSLAQFKVIDKKQYQSKIAHVQQIVKNISASEQNQKQNQGVIF